jgi:hypothetical protein
MPKFTANVHVHGESGPVFFAEGDEAPDWAVALVGDHVLDSGPEGDDADDEPDPTEPESEADSEPDDAEQDPEPETKASKDDEPDFTAAAPRRGRNRRS